jgi:uncharacterized RDD family membrane protein YckC
MYVLEGLEMNAPNPYAPPRAAVSDIADPSAGVELAGRGTRLVATILDSIIILAAVYVPLIALSGGTTISPDGEVQWGAMASVGGIVACIAFLVWAWFTYKFVKENGQTIAKKLMGIKVVRTDGSPASVGRIFWLRNVVNGVLSIIPLYGLIDALLIFGEQRKCIHDKIADTIVVKA